MNASDAVTLREYVEAVFHEYRQAHRREHELTAESVQRAREVVDARLEAMNELRSQILSERGEFLRRPDIAVLTQRLDALERLQRDLLTAALVPVSNDIDDLKKSRDSLNGRVAALVAGLAVGLAALQILLKIVVP